MKFLLPITFFALAACSDDKEDEPEIASTDYYPAEVQITVVDSGGNNLFSYKYHGSLDRDNLASTITYTYKGETKPLQIKNVNGAPYEPTTKASRAYFPRFYGVYVDYYVGTNALGLPAIRFGEFDGVEDHNESVIINWPDGTHNKIEFTSEALNAMPSMMTRVDDGKWYNTYRVEFVK